MRSHRRYQLQPYRLLRLCRTPVVGHCRPLTYANDPDKAVTQTPASESQTQVAVNSEGKTRSASRRVTLATSKNEQTKGVKEPLQQSQTAPKDTKQKEQQDNAVKQDKPEKI